MYYNLKYCINKRIKVTVDKNTDRNNKFPQKESIKLLSRQVVVETAISCNGNSRTFKGKEQD